MKGKLWTVTGSLRYINQTRNRRMQTETKIIEVTAALMDTEFIMLFPLSDNFLQIQKTLNL